MQTTHSLDPFMMKLIESEWLLFGVLVQVIAMCTMSHDKGFKMSMSPRT